MSRTQNEAQKSKPAHEIRLGNIRATIWKNEGEDGPRYNVTFSRGYKVDGGWKNSDSFGRDDLPRVIKCADLAYEWIFSSSGNTPDDEAATASSTQPAGQY